MGDAGKRDDALLREVVALRARVAELQRAAARHEDTDGVSLAEREELVREAERVAHLGTWTWDIRSGRVTWSDEMYRIVGVTPLHFTPSVDDFFSRVHPDDREQARKVTEQGIEEGVFRLHDCRIIRPDGSARNITITGGYLFDEAGQPRRMVGSVLDRTQSLEAEMKLRRTLALMEEAQSFARLGSWRFVPETGETEWSREFRRIAGLADDIPANVETFLERILPEDRTRFVSRYQAVLADPEGGEIYGRVRQSESEVCHVRVSGALVLGEAGKPELRGTILDVTDQVRKREELLQSQSMEAVGRLAGGIAHDFNNLLTIVSGNLDLLEDRVGQCAEFDDSKQALESAANLTRRLLAFGRKAQLSLQVVEPNQLVTSTMNLMNRLVGDQVRLELHLATTLPCVRVDPLEIERALVNLVVNARDVMPGGGVVRISTRLSRKDAVDWVELSVEDQGPGIPDTDRPHIFEPFYTTRITTGGTGLGLATVLGTAEQHGGTVLVSTKQGVGSTFTMMLPATKDRALGPPSSVEVRSGPREIKSYNILLVDDEPMVAKVTRKMLKARGHEVLVATRAAEAQAIWAKHATQIDVVICDVVMPELRGPDLIAKLATTGCTPVVLFMSGYSDEATLSDLGHPVLSKPFTPRALEDALRSLVGTESEKENEPNLRA